MRVLVTGSAGFIGHHTCDRLLRDGHTVTGIDNYSPYYDVALKKARTEHLSRYDGFRCEHVDLGDRAALSLVFKDAAPDIVIHLAAQAGVRHSLDQPSPYIDANVTGTFNLLEQLRTHPVDHFLAASTSSVYGADTPLPFRETATTKSPVSIYAATKLSAEQLGHTYSHLFNIPTTYCRFFSTYGPWNRPDLALSVFTGAILNDASIDVYNHGEMARDFTFIDDLVEALMRLIAVRPEERQSEHDSLSAVAPFRTVNIGRGQGVSIRDLISELEAALGKTVQKNYLPKRPGEILRTEASTDLLKALTGFVPQTPLKTGLPFFVDWYRQYHGR
ncbi:MAG: NAD-dependent epimerase/dehydratase family protein [Pseudomonadota bacterium]